MAKLQHYDVERTKCMFKFDLALNSVKTYLDSSEFHVRLLFLFCREESLFENKSCLEFFKPTIETSDPQTYINKFDHWIRDWETVSRSLLTMQK